MSADVVVVGAGPVGAMLAAELRLGGAHVVLLEQLTEPSGHSRAFRLQPHTLDLLDQRGLLDRFLDGTKAWTKAHFAGLSPLLDLGRLGNDHPYALLIPQTRTEELLEKHALDLGVDLRRGHRLIALEQSAGQVVARVGGPDGEYDLPARYVVGCDGGRSSVRTLAGIPFTGTDPTVSALLGDVELVDPGQLPNGVPGTMRTPRGLMMAISVVPGVTRVLTTEFDQPLPDRDAPVTLDDLRDSVRRITGLDVTMDQPRWLSRFNDTTRMVDDYRQGRVLLAGDAAHVHFPIGAQGLNLGLADAVNLGWKLAATVAGWAPPELLDSYDAERRVTAARVLRECRAQLALMNPDPRVDPLRELFSELLALPDVNLWLSTELSGLDQRPGDAPAGNLDGWAGRPRPPLTVTTAAERTGLGTFLRAGRGVLITTPSHRGHATPAAAGADRIDLVEVDRIGPAADPGADLVGALLLRPDGQVAWAASSSDPAAEGLTDGLRRWFG